MKKVKLSPAETARIQKEYFSVRVIDSFITGDAWLAGTCQNGFDAKSFFQMYAHHLDMPDGGLITLWRGFYNEPTMHFGPPVTEINYVDMYVDFGFSEYGNYEAAGLQNLLNKVLDRRQQSIAQRKMNAR